MDEIDLPSIAEPQHQSRPPLSTNQSSSSIASKKRPRLEFDTTYSSDPALFSSDDADQSAENYAQKRRKDIWTGTWWGDKNHADNCTRQEKSKRKFARNFDSGIFMGSDNSNSSFDDGIFEELDQSTAASSKPMATTTSHYSSVRRKSMRNALKQYCDIVDEESSREKAAQKDDVICECHTKALHIVNKCVDEGAENVDLRFVCQYYCLVVSDIMKLSSPRNNSTVNSCSSEVTHQFPMSTRYSTKSRPFRNTRSTYKAVSC